MVILPRFAVMQSYISRDYIQRWHMIGGCALASLIGLRRMQVDPAFWHVLMVLIELSAVLLVAALALSVAPARFAKIVRAPIEFFLSLGQHAAFIVASFALPYIAASLNLPLLDAAFAQFDIWLSFDSLGASAWIAAHPAVQSALWFSYCSMLAQIIFCLFLHRRGGEFAWLFMVTLIVISVLSAFMPALGHAGMIGDPHISVLQAARAGSVSGVAGIVTFPSFHAALGVVFIYACRVNRYALAVALPLNVLLIIATPHCGGHYLVDVFAGLAVAGVTIAAARRLTDRTISAAPAHSFRKARFAGASIPSSRPGIPATARSA